MASLMDVLKYARQRKMPFAIAAIGDAGALVEEARKMGLIAVIKTAGTAFISVGCVQDIARLAQMPDENIEYVTITSPCVGLLSSGDAEKVTVIGRLSVWLAAQLSFGVSVKRTLFVQPTDDSSSRLSGLIEIAKRSDSDGFRQPIHNIRVLSVGDQICVRASGECYTVVMT